MEELTPLDIMIQAYNKQKEKNDNLRKALHEAAKELEKKQASHFLIGMIYETLNT